MGLLLHLYIRKRSRKPSGSAFRSLSAASSSPPSRSLTSPSLPWWQRVLPTYLRPHWIRRKSVRHHLYDGLHSKYSVGCSTRGKSLRRICPNGKNHPRPLEQHGTISPLVLRLQRIFYHDP